MLAGVGVVNKVGAILKGTDVEAVVFEIDSYRCTRGATGTIKVNRRQIWAGAGDWR